MDDLPQPLRANKPTLLDLWLSYHFDIPTLASSANRDTGVVDAMMKSLPVLEDDAKQILAQLSACYHKDYTLDTVHVVLKKPMINKSEVARVMQEINAQYESALAGLSGLASGTSQHVILTARTEIMARQFAELCKTVGDDIAMQIVFEQETETRTPGSTHILVNE